MKSPTLECWLAGGAILSEIVSPEQASTRRTVFDVASPLIPRNQKDSFPRIYEFDRRIAAGARGNLRAENDLEVSLSEILRFMGGSHEKIPYLGLAIRSGWA